MSTRWFLNPSERQADWPALPYAEWEATRDTLHMWTQIVGKIRLGLMPMINHWWQVPLYVSARGLTTSLMPAGDAGLEVEFDFIDHLLDLRTTDGEHRRITLEPRSVADFYAAVMTALAQLNVPVRINEYPCEIAGATRFSEDRVHGRSRCRCRRRSLGPCPPSRKPRARAPPEGGWRCGL